MRGALHHLRARRGGACLSGARGAGCGARGAGRGAGDLADEEDLENLRGEAPRFTKAPRRAGGGGGTASGAEGGAGAAPC